MAVPYNSIRYGLTLFEKSGVNTQVESKQNIKLLQRSFLNVGGVEVEVCTNNGKYFVRHQTYWNITWGNKNPDPVHECVIDNLKIIANNRLSTIRWAGYDFQFERIAFEDGMEVETVLLPLKMFEDFIYFQAKNHRGEPPDNECARLVQWLENKSLQELLT